MSNMFHVEPLKHVANWFRFIFGGQALLARLWRENHSLKRNVADIEFDLVNAASEIAKLKTAAAESQLAAYRPPATPEPTPPVVKCRTMKEFNVIRERELANAD